MADTDPAVQAAIEARDAHREVDTSEGVGRFRCECGTLLSEIGDYDNHITIVEVEAARPITARQVVLQLHREGYIDGAYVSAALDAAGAADG